MHEIKKNKRLISMDKFIYILGLSIILILIILIIKNWGWLNSNSGGIQAIATFVLVIVTGIYVILIYQSLQEQRRLREKEKYQQMQDYVIIPILEILANNYFYLENGDIGYEKNFYTTKEEKFCLRNINLVDANRIRMENKDVIVSDLYLIIEDFYTKFSKIKNIIEEYNEFIKDFGRIVNEYAENIYSLKDFKEEITKKWNEYFKNGVPGERVSGGMVRVYEYRSIMEEEFLSIINYIINNNNENYLKYSCKSFLGNPDHKNLILNIKDRKELRETRRKFEESLSKLLKDTESLYNEIEKIRKKISEEYGLRYLIRKINNLKL